MTVPDESARSEPASTASHTRGRLAADLRRIGLCAGDTLLVQSSLRSLGLVVGGAVTVVQALLDVVGLEGTIVVPTYTAGNCDPSRWALTRGQSVPQDSWPAVRDRMPPFDPILTPSERVGLVSEVVRGWPGAARSAHPQTSFAAVGARAVALTAGHSLDCHLGRESPLARLEESRAKILLLGVPFGVCTAFHLAEYDLPNAPTRDYECVISVDGERTWFRYRDVVLDDHDFGPLGTTLEASPTGRLVRRGLVGDADSRLLPLAESVAFARAWLTANRTLEQPG
jgi:aminoglycoside 3-N-acetyltransferase